jgi:hypothetical protein
MGFTFRERSPREPHMIRAPMTIPACTPWDSRSDDDTRANPMGFAGRGRYPRTAPGHTPRGRPVRIPDGTSAPRLPYCPCDLRTAARRAACGPNAAGGRAPSRDVRHKSCRHARRRPLPHTSPPFPPRDSGRGFRIGLRAREARRLQAFKHVTTRRNRK